MASRGPKGRLNQPRLHRPPSCWPNGRAASLMTGMDPQRFTSLRAEAITVVDPFAPSEQELEPRANYPQEILVSRSGPSPDTPTSCSPWRPHVAWRAQWVLPRGGSTTRIARVLRALESGVRVWPDSTRESLQLGSWEETQGLQRERGSRLLVWVRPLCPSSHLKSLFN